MRLVVGLLMLAVSSATANAKCIELTPGTRLSFAGKLEQAVFPGPPNYESIENGDSPEPTYVLFLKKNICIDDGGQFADPTNMFNSWQLFATSEALWATLKKLNNRRVTVHGSAFAAIPDIITHRSSSRLKE